MRINFICKSVLVAATVYMLPAVVLASPKVDQPGARTVEFNKGAASSDALPLLGQIQGQAVRVRNNADRLQSLLRTPFLTSWEIDADYLNRVRAHVNRLNNLVSQLRAGEAKDSALQKKVIEQIVPTAAILADTTEDAIVTLKHNESRVFATDLDGLANDIYKDASLIDQTAGDLGKYKDARHEVRQLNQTLGLKSNS